MSARNDFNGTTTIITPLLYSNASSINSILLPNPVSITTTIGLSPYYTTYIASAYALRITTGLRIIYYN